MSNKAKKNDRLTQIFDQICDNNGNASHPGQNASEDNESKIHEEGLRRLLLDNDIDESLVIPMFRLIAGWKSDGISCERFTNFCNDMEKKDINLFYKYLFDFLDVDSDKRISEVDLQMISRLFGDSMQLDEAETIITDTKLLDYDNFTKAIQNTNYTRQ